MPRWSTASASKGMCTCTSAMHMNTFIQPSAYLMYIFKYIHIYIYSMIYLVALHVVSKGMKILHNLEMIRYFNNMYPKALLSTSEGISTCHIYYPVSSRLAKASLPKPPPSCSLQGAGPVSCCEAAHMPTPLAHGRPAQKRQPRCHGWQWRCPPHTLKLWRIQCEQVLNGMQIRGFKKKTSGFIWLSKLINLHVWRKVTMVQAKSPNSAPVRKNHFSVLPSSVFAFLVFTLFFSFLRLFFTSLLFPYEFLYLSLLSSLLFMSCLFFLFSFLCVSYFFL